MSSQSRVGRYVESQGEGGQYDSEGAFRLADGQLQKRYASLLERPREAVLFLLQSAQRLDAKRVRVSVERRFLSLTVLLPEHKEKALETLGDLSAGWPRELPPEEDPLYELVLGLNVLACSCGGRKIALFRRSTYERYLRVEISYAREPGWWSGFSGAAKSRMKFAEIIEKRSFCAFPLELDGQDATGGLLGSVDKKAPFCQPYFTFLTGVVGQRRAAGSEPRRVNIRTVTLDRHTFAVSVDQAAHQYNQPFFVAQTRSKPPTAEFHAAVADGVRTTQLIPIRHGVSLAPLNIAANFGNVRLYFDASTLPTDVSTLQLRESKSLSKRCLRLLHWLRRYLGVLKAYTEDFQPEVRWARTALRRSTAAGAVIGTLACVGCSPWSPLFPLVLAAATKVGAATGGATMTLLAAAEVQSDRVGGMKNSYTFWLTEPGLAEIPKALEIRSGSA